MSSDGCSDLEGAAALAQQQDNQLLLAARLRAMEQAASQLNGTGAPAVDAAAALAAMTATAAAAAGGGGDSYGGSARVPGAGLTRTHSSPLPLQVLHQQSLWLQRQQQEVSSYYVKQVRAYHAMT